MRKGKPGKQLCTLRVPGRSVCVNPSLWRLKLRWSKRRAAVNCVLIYASDERIRVYVYLYIYICYLSALQSSSFFHLLEGMGGDGSN